MRKRDKYILGAIAFIVILLVIIGFTTDWLYQFYLGLTGR